MNYIEIINHLDQIFVERKTILDFYEICNYFQKSINVKKALPLKLKHEIYHVLVQNSKYIFCGHNNWGYYKFFKAAELTKLQNSQHYSTSKIIQKMFNLEE